MVELINNRWWQLLAGSMLVPEWRNLGGEAIPVSYVLELCAPALDRRRIIEQVTQVLGGFNARAATVGVPDKDEVLVGARGYRVLPRQAFTDYNRKELTRIFSRQFSSGEVGLSKLYMLDLLALGLAVINWLMNPVEPGEKEDLYAQMVQDWLRVAMLSESELIQSAGLG